MASDRLNVEETVELFRFVSKFMIDQKDILTKADQKIGDGDHGIGIARGFEAIIDLLEATPFDELGALLKKIGFGLMNSMGGASGAIFGTFFLGAAKAISQQDYLDSENLGLMLKGGLDAVKNRGKANPGDKTMVDALEPAALAADSQISLVDNLAAVTEASRLGMEKTKEMVANFGRAKSLGEKAIGHADPGSISMHLLLKSMTEYVQKK